MSAICQFNQYGYCKYGTRCDKFHTTTTCDSFPCENSECGKRHPKLCQYFAVYGWCRFAEKCSFLHYNSSRCVHSSTSQGLQEVLQAMSELKNEFQTLRLEVDRLGRQNRNMVESMRQLNREEDTGHEDEDLLDEARVEVKASRVESKEELDAEPEPSVEEYCDELVRGRYEEGYDSVSDERCISVLVGIITILNAHKNGEVIGKIKKSGCLNKIRQLQDHSNDGISYRAQIILMSFCSYASGNGAGVPGGTSGPSPPTRGGRSKPRKKKQ